MMPQGPGGLDRLPPGSYGVVAHVHGYPPHLWAGAEFMLHTMLRRLVDDGVNVLVTTPRYHDLEVFYELDGVHVFTTRFFGSTREYARSARLLVSHLGLYPQTWAMAREFGVPVAAVVHNDMRDTREHLRVWPADLVVWNSRWVRESVRQPEVLVEEDGVSLEDAKPFPDEGDELVVRPPVLLDEYRTTPGDRVTLINHNKDKGGLLFQRLAELMPERQFLAVTGSHGEQVCQPASNLEVAGMTMNMRDDVYGRTRILLMPSVYESWGRVAVEAMASGIPVVAHPTPGLRECLGSAGTFVDRDDAAGWVDVVRRFDDPAVYASVSAAARARASALDPERDLAVWADAVNKLIGV
jgi:glycosyltransferase involved in cell wall biosynthesis